MINKEQISQLATTAIAELDVYIADILVKSDNRIFVFLEADGPVHIEDCIIVSKFIENSLDRDVEDFEINVSSYGATQPLKFPRQYIKNIGRDIEITLKDESEIIGEIKGANDEEVTVMVVPKKKKDPSHLCNIKYNEIIEAKIMISFK
jgi:ribosome maturation factor RimP